LAEEPGNNIIKVINSVFDDSGKSKITLEQKSSNCYLKFIMILNVLITHNLLWATRN
jgi:hypothetical protein